MTVVATAGHVDHGKSTLVQALTGVDPDRWPEEKRRGRTIDLGFATLPLPAGAIAFVDVPGHERFIRNMLAGVGSIEACLLVVAASEGWKPQSEEHLQILDLLGVRRGVVALTMVDRVDAERVDAVRSAVSERLARSTLAGAPVLPVSAPAGIGIDALRDALGLLARGPEPAVGGDRPRLWVDRSFTLTGIGTVVTGTLTGGTLRTGDRAVLEPGGQTVRIRGLQIDGHEEAAAEPGRRVAVNLAQVNASTIHRGQAVVTPGRWHLSRKLDASLRVLDTAGAAITSRGSHLLYLGTGEWPVRLQPLGARSIDPGQRGLVRLHLPGPIPILPGDRFVLRDSGRSRTVGGGEVLDVAPVLPPGRARPDRRVDRVVKEHGWITTEDLERLTGLHRAPQVGRWVVAPDALEAATRHLRDQVASVMPLGLDLGSLGERDQVLVRDGHLADLEVTADRVRLASIPDPLAEHPWVLALTAEPFAPPPPEGVEADELRLLVRQGSVVALDGIYFPAASIDAAARVAAGLLATHPPGITVADARQAMATSRRFAVPLLAELDRRGITRRRGDRRIAGPNLPSVGDTASGTSPPKDPSG